MNIRENEARLYWAAMQTAAKHEAGDERKLEALNDLEMLAQHSRWPLLREASAAALRQFTSAADGMACA